MADHPTGLVERTFAEQLRSFRRGRHLTQEQLAERAGLCVRTISGLESEARRHDPYPDTLSSLGSAAAWQKRFEQAEKLMTRSLAVYQTEGQKWGIIFMVARLGDLAGTCGDYGVAASRLREALALTDLWGDGELRVFVLAVLGRARFLASPRQAL